MYPNAPYIYNRVHPLLGFNKRLHHRFHHCCARILPWACHIRLTVTRASRRAATRARTNVIITWRSQCAVARSRWPGWRRARYSYPRRLRRGCDHRPFLTGCNSRPGPRRRIRASATYSFGYRRRYCPWGDRTRSTPVLPRRAPGPSLASSCQPPSKSGPTRS